MWIDALLLPVFCFTSLFVFKFPAFPLLSPFPQTDFLFLSSSIGIPSTLHLLFLLHLLISAKLGSLSPTFQLLYLLVTRASVPLLSLRPCASNSSFPSCGIYIVMIMCKWVLKLSERLNHFSLLHLRANRSEGQSWWQPPYPFMHCGSVWRTRDKFRDHGQWNTGTSEDWKQTWNRGDRELESKTEERPLRIKKDVCGQFLLYKWSPTACYDLWRFSGRWVNHLYYLKTVEDTNSSDFQLKSQLGQDKIRLKKQKRNDCK